MIKRTFLAIFIGLFVLILTSYITLFSNSSSFIKTYPWFPISHSIILITSLILIFFLSKGDFRSYGFKKVRYQKLKRPFFIGIIMGFSINLLYFFLPVQEFDFLKKYNFTQSILFIVFFASISEEIFIRGLIQSYLSPLRSRKYTILKTDLSYPVIFSALFFAFMHLGLLTTGIDMFTVSLVTFFAFLIGLIAGFYCEKTSSIIPAILIHILINLWGCIFDHFLK